MTQALAAGSILIEEGTLLPDSVLLESESYSSGWAAVMNRNSTLDNEPGRRIETTHRECEAYQVQQFRDYTGDQQVVPKNAVCEYHPALTASSTRPGLFLPMIPQ